MISNCYNLSEDWGWYIDIESMKPIYQNNPEIIRSKNKNNIIKYRLNRLEAIEEDEYDYYINNIKNNEYKNDLKNIDFTINETDDNMKSNIITNYGSTTLITVLITYIVFFIL
jgi:hypothetical protein